MRRDCEHAALEVHQSSVLTTERTLDQLVSPSILAKESNHPKTACYNAVLRAMQEKFWVPDYQYKQYLRSLLGDKNDEKVLDAMTKVKKAMRVAESGPSQGKSRGWDRVGVRCFSCGQMGHFQRFCLYKLSHPAKRQRTEQVSQDHTKN